MQSRINNCRGPKYTNVSSTISEWSYRTDDWLSGLARCPFPVALVLYVWIIAQGCLTLQELDAKIITIFLLILDPPGPIMSLTSNGTENASGQMMVTIL